MKSDKSIRSIAFIMDGNGRWATSRLMPRNMGHKEGVEVMMRITKACRDRGIPYVSFYAFSTENKNRSGKEVDGLLSLIGEKYADFCNVLVRCGYKLNVMGDIMYFNEKIRRIIEEGKERTKDLDFGVVNLGLNYGGRSELERAAQLKAKSGIGAPISDFLYTAGQPDPDLLIRTGGEKRLSNFMLYQLAYTELFFSDTYWPDFSEDELDALIKEFFNRNRRFGK